MKPLALAFFLIASLLVHHSEAAPAKAPKSTRVPATSSGETACNAEALRGGILFLDENKKEAWIAVTPNSEDLFQALGFKRSGSFADAIASSLKPVNLGPCTGPEARNQVFGKASFPFTVFSDQACTAQLARKLGLEKTELENYGSMEAGMILYGGELEVCSDGQTILPCSRLKGDRAQALSRACWRNLR